MRPPDAAGAAGQGTERRVVALVRGLHGLDGAVRLEVLTDHPDDRFAPGVELFPEGSTRPLVVAWSAVVADGPGWRLGFVGRPDRSAVEDLRGVYLEAVVEPAADLEPEAVYWHEVIGVEVTSVDGSALGVVRDIYRAGGAEVYVVREGPSGEFDLPAVAAVIREFAPREGRIVVDPDALGLETGPRPGRAPSSARLARGVRRREEKARREAEIERAEAAAESAATAEPSPSAAAGPPAADAGDAAGQP